MTAKISDYKDVVYSRDYSKDVPREDNLAKRVALAALPFFSLYAPLRQPISIAMGTLRLWHTQEGDIGGAVFAGVALATAIFQHRIGMAITTVHDLVTEIQNLINAPNDEEALKTVVKIFNHLVYLAMIAHGGLALSIVGLMLQASINLMQSHDELKQGRWIEGISNLLMMGVRLQQTYTQCHQVKRNWEIKAAIKRVHIGDLREKWRFPSDHLPVGIEVNGVRIISWNVLNSAYMEWVTDHDTQGLNKSLITELHKPVNDKGLTERDVVVASMVRSMMEQGQVVALQECSQPFLEHLQKELPSDWDMVRSLKGSHIDQDVVLYNKSNLTYNEGLSETTKQAYPSAPGRPLQNVFLSKRAGGDLRIINAHIPGDPLLPGRDEFAKYVRGQIDQKGTPIVALGDNNFERDEMIDAFYKAGVREMSVHAPYQTNIGIDKASKAIDIFTVINGSYSRDLKPEELLRDHMSLKNTVRQLQR